MYCDLFRTLFSALTINSDLDNLSSRSSPRKRHTSQTDNIVEIPMLSLGIVPYFICSMRGGAKQIIYLLYLASSLDMSYIHTYHIRFCSYTYTCELFFWATRRIMNVQDKMSVISKERFYSKRTKFSTVPMDMGIQTSSEHHYIHIAMVTRTV